VLSQINKAIEDKKRLIIKKYQSASSESVSDRTVEPIGFTTNYQYLCAFELESNQNKYFKLERMGSIEILEDLIKFKNKPQLLSPDVFGFNDSGTKYPVKLKMSMRTMLFLKDDYPETANFLTEQNDGFWLLNVEVNSMDPVNRVLRSMPGEIEIL
jgi:predicted DNA-binding transcriptional regulator YafY